MLIQKAQYTPIVHAPAICLSQKWQLTQVGKNFSCSQWVEAACTQWAQVFFSFGGRVGHWIILGSQCVPIKFPMGSYRVSQVPNVCPYMFSILLTLSISSALSFTLFIYISSPNKDITTYLLGDSPKLDLLPFVKRKKKELWGSPQPSNMRHNILPY
jgi:hypothetical protein